MARIVDSVDLELQESAPETCRGFKLDQFPAQLQKHIQIFDTDGDGTIDEAEIVRAAELYKESKTQNTKLWRALAIVSLFALLLVALNVTTTVLAVDAAVFKAKDTSVSASGVLTAKGGGVPVLTATQETQVPLGAAPYLGMLGVEKLEHISIIDPTDGRVMRVTVDFIDASPAANGMLNFTFTGTKGHTIDVRDAVNAVFRYPDGRKFTFCAQCGTCGSTSLTETAEVAAAVERSHADAVQIVNRGGGRQCRRAPADGAASSNLRRGRSLQSAWLCKILFKKFLLSKR